MKTHTTKAGDKFLRSYILETTPWSREAYRLPPGDKPRRIATMFAALAGLVGLLVIVTYVSK